MSQFAVSKALFLLATLALLHPLSVAGQVPSGDARGPDFASHQLLVLLAPGEDSPIPEDVVEAHRRGQPLPANLGVGDPEEVRFLITRRSRGAARQAIHADPSSPQARLERYLVLEYPQRANVDQVLIALLENPDVRHAYRSRVFYLSADPVTPSDPLFPVQPALVDYQWGLHALNLPEAWAYSKGHGYVGVIDTGLDVDHEDLAPFDAVGNYIGGNFRAHLSDDVGDSPPDDDVDEMQGTTHTGAGHGTHVSGIIAATTDNLDGSGQPVGAAGVCWECSLHMEKMVDDDKRFTFEPDVVTAFQNLLDYGVQVVNMSFGHRAPADCTDADLDAFCTELQLAENRDTASFAAAGNFLDDLQFPASDTRVVSIGGIEPGTGPTFNFWDFRDGDPRSCPFAGNDECGSNWTQTTAVADQDFVAPAVDVLSTFYVGAVWNQKVGCVDNADPNTADPEPGYGLCTGTSMAAPHGTGLGGILRSINPLLSKEEVRSLINDNADRAGAWDPQFGFGVPDAAASVQDALGRVGGTVIDNRLTPLFQLEAFTAEDHIYTTSPQMGAALTRGDFYKTDSGDQDYWPQGPDVPGYDYFPGGKCFFVACPAKASVYIFTTDRSPNGHPLVPLYRLSWDAPYGGNPEDRDHNYTTEAAGIEAFADVGYRLDGVEGYIYERCSPEPSCIPAGATRLYRYYNSTRDDWAIFPESELATWEADGYSAQSGANPWIGYVYETVDTDGDWLIDGFEGLIGTDPNTADSDCDGAHDGQELFKDYPYGDPLDGTCSSIVAEVGQVTDLSHVSQTVVLSRSYTNPVVIAQPASYNGPDQSVVRITDVQSDRFTFRIEEAPDRDGGHTFETVSYLVIEAGSWKLPGGTEIEAGKLSTSASVGRNFAGSFATVGFSQAFSTAPLVLTQIQTANDPSWAKTRQLLASTSSFKVALEEEEAATTAHGTETIGWLAVTPGTGVWSGHRFEAASTANAVTHDFFSIGFTQSFRPEVRFLAAQATRDGADNSAVRYTSLSAAGVSVKIEEDTTFDTEVGHTNEVVSYLVLQNDGTLAASPR